MENKYYVPDISEFHYGFEYEMDAGTGWSKQVFPNPWWNNGGMGGIDTLKRCIENKIVRCKILDRQDIEELGWKESGVNFTKSGFYLETYEKHWATIYEDKGADEYAYRGFIRNKSQLRQLMSWLNIE